MRKTIIAFITLVLVAMPLSALATETGPVVLDPTLNPQLPAGVVLVTPTANPVAGDYDSDQSVTLTATGMDSIHYTTNGTDPTCTTGTTYAGAITVENDITIEAIACLEVNGNVYTSNKATFTYEISSGGGGGGSSGSAAHDDTTPVSQMTLAQLQTELTRLIALLAQMQAAAGAGAGVGGPACPYTWTRDLTLNVIGADVLKLQQFLNSNAATKLAVAPGAPGSAGYETTKYGPATLAAVRAYQALKGISPAVGYFGPVTRASANGECI